MTTAVQSRPTVSGNAAGRLVRAELLKIFTTNSWWIFGILTLVTTGLTLTINLLQANYEIDRAEQAKNEPMPDFGSPTSDPNGPTAAERDEIERQYRNSIDLGRILVTNAANVYTSGQLFALLFMVVLGALIVTNEFFHQTATTTFLTSPRRTAVILSKLAAAALLALGFWLAVTALDLAAGSMYFGFKGYHIPLADWPVLRSVLLNLLAYIIWAVLGVGLGVLIRSQLGATLTGAAFYLISWPVALLFFGLLRQFVFQEDWIWSWMVIVPGVASQVMVAAEPLQFGPTQEGPSWWAGALVLVAYGVLASIVGTLITRKRDIS